MKGKSTSYIAINALSARLGGGITYLNRLIDNLNRVDDINEYFIYVTRDNHEKIVPLEKPGFHIIEVPVKNVFQRLLFEQLVMPTSLIKNKIDLLYAPAEIVPILSTCPTILGIQNSNIYYKTEIKHPVRKKIKLWAMRQLARLSSKKAVRIIFVSETARRDISARLSLNDGKTRAIHHGIEIAQFNETVRCETRKGNYSSMGNYILCLSSLARHKNIETLIYAYSRLSKPLKEKYKLVIAGRAISSYIDELTLISSKLDIRDRVIFTGEIPHEEVPLLLSNARLFVLPSILESFGIPLIEAMASKVPVIASNATAIPEIMANAGLLFKAKDPDDLCTQIERVLSDNSLYDDLVKKGLERARQFSWEKCANETLAVFMEALEEMNKS